MNHQLKRPRRRPVEKEWPETIPDTPENVARAIMAGPPKREWNYLKDPVLPLGCLSPYLLIPNNHVNRLYTIEIDRIHMF